MPLIDKIGSLKIKIYYGEHFPAHIHASYNEYEALIDIYTGEVLSGELPLKQLKLCLDWLKSKY